MQEFQNQKVYICILIILNFYFIVKEATKNLYIYKKKLNKIFFILLKYIQQSKLKVIKF